MAVRFFSSQRSKCVTEVTSKKSIIPVGEKNALRALQFTHWQLKPLGIWPMSLDSSCYEKIITNFCIAICLFLLMFLIIPGSLFAHVKIKDINGKIKLTGPLSFCVMAILKYILLLLRRRDISECIKLLIIDWKKNSSIDNQIIMMNYSELGRLGSIICAVFMYGGGIFFAVILPCVTPSIQNEKNITIKPIAYPSYYIWLDPQEHTTYIIIFSIHCCCALVMHSITSSVCSIAVVFAMHACGQLKIITSPLYKAINGKNTISKCKNLDGILPGIIEHHTNILRFIGIMEKILNRICLIEIGGCTLNICFLGYYFLLEWEESDAIGIITYTILLVSFTFNIFLFCYIGDLITEQCENVGKSTYMIDWYTMSGENVRQLILILIIAQNPVTITAGKFVNLSLDSFCAVIRTSVAFLNFLRQFIV